MNLQTKIISFTHEKNIHKKLLKYRLHLVKIKIVTDEYVEKTLFENHNS